MSNARHAAKLTTLAARFGESNELFVRHYRARYHGGPDLPPLWMATESMSFGDLSKWFELTRSAGIKKAVARDLGLPAPDLLVSLLKCLNYVRNVCAHHARLWNRNLTFRPPVVKRLGSDLVRDPMSPNELSDRIYNVLVLLSHVLRTQSPETSWPARIASMMAQERPERLSTMGFPDGWRSRRTWQ